METTEMIQQLKKDLTCKIFMESSAYQDLLNDIMTTVETDDTKLSLHLEAAITDGSTIDSAIINVKTFMYYKYKSIKG